MTDSVTLMHLVLSALTIRTIQQQPTQPRQLLFLSGPELLVHNLPHDLIRLSFDSDLLPTGLI